MSALPPLESLGRRIAIMGPTNSGKSTLAEALGRKLGVPAIHLDQFRHLPNTDWQVRPDDEFHTLHDAAILGDGWVMDGNYSVLLPKRFSRATGLIVLDDHVAWRALRYFRRTLVQPRRAGGLPGNRDSIKWTMIHWLWKTRQGAERYRKFAAESGLPVVECHSLAEVKALGRSWGL